MLINDLVAIGKLGKSVDKKGFIPFKEFYNFQQFNLQDVFLLFTDNRVRYVSIVDIDDRNNIKLDDDEIMQEAALDGNVSVMLAPEDFQKILQDNEIVVYVGKQIFSQKKHIGKVVESFHNGAQEVLEIETPDGGLFMVPLVEKYLEKMEEDKIFLKDIEGFLEL
jgi:ribosomal 30S subunit maturation factor RimM